MLVLMSRPLALSLSRARALKGELCPLSQQASILIPAGGCPCRAVPCRAVFWSESDRLLAPFSAAGAAGSDVTTAEAQPGGQWERRKRRPPGAESVLHRCTGEEEKGEGERRRGV